MIIMALASWHCVDGDRMKPRAAVGGRHLGRSRAGGSEDTYRAGVFKGRSRGGASEDSYRAGVFEGRSRGGVSGDRSRCGGDVSGDRSSG